ncbi:MAG: thiamine pyrophosphate-binding protein, partial [Actinobacteria bacterium]|nr:thiamine pyrophosphate-binding protein [Actinomycetota bacterium]
MKLSDYLAEFLTEQGVHHVFEVIGGAAVHMVQSIAEAKGIDYICSQHEQGGAMAAEAYSRMTKNLGVAMATSGPGMTNLMTGIACAYFDSIPAVYITGQVNRNESKQGRKARQIGFQETDIVDMVQTITKFAVKVDDPEDIRYLLEKAVYIAKSGRPGPVLIDIPMDVQRAQVDPKKLKKFNPKEIKLDIDNIATVKGSIKESLEMIKHAKRPVIIAGGAIRYADQVKKFEEFVNALGFPVVATWSGIDVLYHDHPLYIGQVGVYGNRGANFTVQNSDCIISIGSRLDTRITGGFPQSFARKAKKIVIDIDRCELFKNRGLTPDIGICADVKDVLPIFIEQLKKVKPGKNKQEIKDWLSKALKWKKQYPSVLPEWRKRTQKVDPYVFIEELSKILKNDAIVVTDCGANLTWTIQAFHVKRGQRLFSAMGNSPMGYAFPASIGASIALNKKPVVCIIGDGGFQINIQELTLCFLK